MLRCRSVSPELQEIFFGKYFITWSSQMQPSTFEQHILCSALTRLPSTRQMHCSRSREQLLRTCILNYKKFMAAIRNGVSIKVKQVVQCPPALGPLAPHVDNTWDAPRSSIA